MSKVKHTPGPWEITGEYSNSQDEIGGANDRCICVVWTRSPSNPYASARSQFRDNPELKANAERIVACVNACEGINPEAVPLILESLKAIVPLMPKREARLGEVDWQRLREIGETAIAKATEQIDTFRSEIIAQRRQLGVPENELTRGLDMPRVKGSFEG